VPTIRQVAARAGVSTATVSRVLARSGRVSPELDARVREAALALHYQPNRAARNLRARHGSTVGVLIPDIQNLFYTAIVRAIDDEIQQHGYTVLLGNSGGQLDREQVYLDTFRAEGAVGVLLVPNQRDDQLYREFQRAQLPMVVLDRFLALPGVDAVTVTNAGGAAEAVRHLVDLGHRRIAMMAGLEYHSVGAERRRGYVEGLTGAGLAVDETLIRDGEFERETARQATHDLLALAQPPTAIFSANNIMSLGVLQALNERGLRAPDDVSIVGFDDMPWQVATHPPLTCVAQPTYEIGAAAARLLMERLAAPGRDAQRVELPTTLIVRGSSGPPPSAAR
jgi:LacI family transcriptional regulator, galactose operon repressor